jgi:hypothetical protein
MGQMLSREDEEYDEQNEQQAEDANEVKEKPKRRRNQAAIRSRKPRAATQGRTRRTRANPITFEVREY